MNDNINVGSYQDMAEGSNTIRRSSSNLKSSLDANRSIENIQKARIFEGPLADHVNSMWGKIRNRAENDITVLDNSASTLDYVRSNYQETDKNSVDTMGGIL